MFQEGCSMLGINCWSDNCQKQCIKLNLITGHKLFSHVEVSMMDISALANNPIKQRRKLFAVRINQYHQYCTVKAQLQC